MKNDQFGFCHEIESEVVKALDVPGREFFIGHFQRLVEDAMPSQVAGELAKPSLNTRTACGCRQCRSRRSMRPWGMFQPTPRSASGWDSARANANIWRKWRCRRHWAKALDWVEKGIALKPTRNWHNEDAYGLDAVKARNPPPLWAGRKTHWHWLGVI